MMNVQLVILKFLVIFAVAFAEKGSPCTTPDGKTATCVPLNTCQVVFNAAFTRNTTALDFARKSFCSYDNELLMLVCCESPGPVISINYETKALPDKTICGLVKEERRIVGGEITDLGEFPWMAAIEYKDKSSGENLGMLCTGSVISKRYILTTAQCVVHAGLEPTSVLLGPWQISTYPDFKELIAYVECADSIQKILVKEKIPHVYFNKRHSYNDIGLLLLENDIKFTEDIKPICLPSPNLSSPESGFVVTVAGWGMAQDCSLSDFWKKVEVPVVSNEVCNEKLKRFNRQISSQQLCAVGELGKDSCQGDAGGPLMTIKTDKSSGEMRWYQEAVVSFGFGSGREGYPCIYPRTSRYMDWIINIITEE